MEEGNSIIYGVEQETRALCAQYSEGDALRFLIGTQCIQPRAQVHVVELEEDTGALHTLVYKHPNGEIWHIRCSPHSVETLMTTHNSFDSAACQCVYGVSIYKLPTSQVIPTNDDEFSGRVQSRDPEDMELLQTIYPENKTEEIRGAEFHHTDATRIGVVYETCVKIHDVVRQAPVCTMAGEPRGRGKCTLGKWSPHSQTQFGVLQDTNIRCYDSRTDGAKAAWHIDSAHKQQIRDLDFNPNRQFHLASVGDDAALNIWDYRNGKEPIFSRTDHSHWVWSVRYNTFHEQLLLTGGGDGRVLLSAASSICRDEDNIGQNNTVEDGVLQSYEQHEDSTYAVEWSTADTWTFASVSYDGRFVLATVPKHLKYRVML